MSMPANQPVIRRGSHSSKLARFKVPIPARIASFFDGPELAEYDGRRAHGLRGWSGDTKLKVHFGSPRLGACHAYASDGHFAGAAALLPIAAAGTETRMFAVDTASPALAVHLFDDEEGWSKFADGFDAFLANLLRKGEKTPTEHLAGAYERAKELHDAAQHADVIATLEPMLARFPEGLDVWDDARGALGAAHNLVGIAHEKAGDLERALAAYRRGLALGADSAGLNIVDLYFDHFHDYAKVIELAEERRRHTWANDAYAWFHLRNYLGRAYLLTERPADAVRAYHQISDRSPAEKVAEAVTDLRELLERPGVDRATAESILAWLARPRTAPPSLERAAELRAWWSELPEPVKEAVRTGLDLEDDADLTDEQLVRATELDELSVTHDEHDDLGWLGMFTRLDDLSLEGTGISDVAPIARHTSLTRLDLGENQVTSLRPLAALTRLVRLACGENPLGSLDGVEAMRDLRDLHAPKTGIASLEPLRGLPELVEVTLYENEIEDLAPLATCPRLKKISAFSNPLARGVAALAALPWLESVHCGDAGPRDEIDQLRRASAAIEVEHWTHPQPERADDGDPAERRAWWSALPPAWRARLAKLLDRDERDRPEPSDEALRALLGEDHVSLDEGPLPDLEPLRRFVRADYVCIAQTGATDLAAVAALPRLRDLVARDNPLTSLAPLAAARHLEELYLQRCGVASLAGLEGCPALRELSAEDNAIADLSPLTNLAELRELDLEGNRVASVTALAGKARLHTLRLGQNRITDVSALATCTSLRTLEIWANPGVRGAIALAALPELRRLISHGALPPRELDELRRRRPDLVVD
ncbi:MAG: hypothetical protein KF773_21495 [Deltaproteobacteria bacterium]|nr:hypothetical protein [Deltaproteobacteria bacterium]